MTLTAPERLRLWREKPQVMVRELFGVTPDPWQDEALSSFPSNPRLALQSCAGPGKGHRLDMLIDTPEDGAVKWGDLRPGWKVFAADGTITTVTSIHPLGLRAIYRVFFDDGSFCDVTEDHLWKVRGRTERRHFNMPQPPKDFPPDGYSVLTTLQIIERNKLPDGQKRRQFEIPTQGAVQYPMAQLPLDAYVVGVWLGDGKAGHNGYHKPYVEVEQEINRRGYQTRRGLENNVTLLGVKQDFRDAMGDLFEANSPDRFIPDRYKRSSVQQRTDLLCGLMDTDGCIGDDGHMEYDTTSERLANDVVWLARSVGGMALIKASIKQGWYRDVDGNRVDCLNCYRVTVTLPFNPFRIMHKRNRWHMPQRRYLTRYIDRIERVDDAEAMCITVEHPSHCYLANDFIVTHNTAVLAWLGWGFLLTRSHSVIGVASITSQNLKSNLWAELARWRNKVPVLMQEFEQTGEAIFQRDNPQTWRLEARSWARDANAEQIGNALAGLHAQYVMWLLDETGDYPMAVLPVCEGIFNGNPLEAHIVQAGNPTRRGGPLWHAASAARALWKLIKITADPDDPMRTPRVSVEIANQQIQQYGRDNPWVKVRIFGEFPDADFNALIGPDEVEAAMRRYYRKDEIGDAPLVFGVDVAAQGDDSSVVFPRRGIQALKPFQYRNINSTQGAAQINRMWSEFDVDAVFIDATGGFGTGWIDQLRVLNREPVGVQFAGKAHQDKRFANKRTEMYFDAVQWIKDGGALPPNVPELVAALTQTTYTFNKDRLLLEPKEQIKAKIGYSPDHADAFCLSFAEPVLAANRNVGPPRKMASEWEPFAEKPAPRYATEYDPLR